MKGSVNLQISNFTQNIRIQITRHHGCAQTFEDLLHDCLEDSSFIQELVKKKCCNIYICWEDERAVRHDAVYDFGIQTVI